MVASSSITSTGRPSPSSSGMPATSDAARVPALLGRCATPPREREREQRNLVQICARDRVQQPPAGRVRGHRPEDRGLVSQRGDVADALTTVDEHHRHDGQHPDGIMRGERRRMVRERCRQLRRQRGLVSQIRDKPRARMRHEMGASSGHDDGWASTGSVYVLGAFLSGDESVRQSQNPVEARPSRSSGSLGN